MGTSQKNGIVLRPLSSLKRWEDNYRQGDVDAIVASITRFGFNGAFRVWKGTVIAGNHALIALEVMRSRGDSAPVGVDDNGKDWLVPCIDISRLKKSEAEAFAIADNRTHDLGSDDEGRLAVLLARIQQSDEELMVAAGYSSEDLEALLALSEEPEFEPGTEEQQGQLDQKALIRCPKCGHEFAQG